MLGYQPDDLNPGNVRKFTDRLQADLGLAARDGSANRWGRSRLAGHRLYLRFDLVKDAEIVHDLRHMDTAGAAARRIGIGDRASGEQRLFERLNRADIGFGGALPNREGNRRAADHDNAVGDNRARGFERLQARLGRDRDIENVVGSQPLRDLTGGTVGEGEMIP